MDILLSLPIVSYLFSTSLTSWSTSLNLLFFYMTWSTLVLSHSPLKIEIVGTTALRIALWLVPSLLFLAFDTILPSLSANLKFNGDSALPPRDPKSLLRLTGLALLNLALETAVEAAISLGLSIIFGSPVFRTSTTLPLPWQMLKHIALLLAAREVLTYYIHRHLLHGQPAPSLSVSGSGCSRSSSSSNRRTILDRLPTPRLRGGSSKASGAGRLPRLHTTASPPHARGAPPFSLLLKADHPLPYLLHRFLPVYLPALLLHYYTTYTHTTSIPTSITATITPGSSSSGGGGGLHLLTYLLFVALATLEETLAMSGYAVVPGIVMRGVARRTALHYCGSSSGNFGTWGVLDWAHGTSLGRDVVGDLRAEAGKHALGQRAGQAVDGVGSAVQGGDRDDSGSGKRRRNGRSGEKKNGGGIGKGDDK